MKNKSNKFIKFLTDRKYPVGKFTYVCAGVTVVVIGVALAIFNSYDF